MKSEHIAVTKVSSMNQGPSVSGIVGVQSMAKQVTGKCVTCKKLRRQPLEQMMGQISKLSVVAGFPAFNNTAIDMFGPLQLRIGRKTQKEAQVIILHARIQELYI